MIPPRMDVETLKQFLFESKMEGYAGGGSNYKAGKISGSKTFTRRRENLTYVDTYIGFTYFAGQEIVLEKNIPQWTSVYSGGITEDSIDPYEIYNFLKLCLRECDPQMPLRGKDYFSNGQFEYKNIFEGDMDHFIGYESIESEQDIVYELHYSGGTLIL